MFFLFCNRLTVFLFYFYSFNKDGEISLHSGSHRMNDKNTVPVWGCIGLKHGPNVLKKLISRLDTTQYKELLSLHVFPYCNDRLFIHDYFPVHSAKSVKEFIASNGMKVIEDWPRKSGDLMPLETIWRQILSKLSGTLVFDENNLWRVLRECWDDMDRDGLLFDSINALPKRFRQVLKDDGDWVKDQ